MKKNKIMDYNIKGKKINIIPYLVFFVVGTILSFISPKYVLKYFPSFSYLPNKMIIFIVFSIFLVIFLYILIYAMKDVGRKYMRGKEYGTGKYENVEIFTKSLENKKNPNCNMILSVNGRKSLDSKETLLNNNTLVVGGSGAGKTAGFVAVNILQNYGCNVITDPKGDTARDYGIALEQKGRLVKKLDLTDMKTSLQFNPFPYLKEEEQISELVDNIVDNTTKDNASGSDPFWENSEKMFDKCLFFYVASECPCAYYKYTQYKINEDSIEVNIEKELPHMIDEMSGDPKFAKRSARGVSLIPIYKTPVKSVDGHVLELSQTFRSVLKLLSEAQVKDNGASDLDCRMLFLKEKIRARGELLESNKCIDNYEKTMRGAADTVRSIVISANARFDQFNNEALLRILDDDELDLESLFTGKAKNREGITHTDLFLVIPDDKSTYNFVVGMIYTLLFQIGYQVARREGGICPMPVGLWMDEFANIKMPNDFKSILSTCRSRDIFIVIILQSLSQLKTLYPNDEYEEIIGNCDSFLYLGGNEPGSHSFVSDALGEMTIDKKSHGQSFGRQGSSSTNDDSLGRKVLTEQEVSMLPNDECIFNVRGHYPVRDKKCYWFKMPEYQYLKKLKKWNTKVYIKKVAERYITLRGSDILDYKGILVGDEANKFIKENNCEVINTSFANFLFNNDFDESLTLAKEELNKNEVNSLENLDVLEEINKSLSRNCEFEDKIQKALKRNDDELVLNLLYSQNLTDEQFRFIKQALDEGMSAKDIEKFAVEGMGLEQMKFIKEMLKNG